MEDMIQDNILTLTDANGNEVDFEYLDTIEYQNDEYLVLLPEDNNEIIILKIESVDDENENYLPVESEATLKAVYNIFKNKYKDVLDFEE